MKRRTQKAKKGVKWMPRHWMAMKDVIAAISFGEPLKRPGSEDFPMGKPTPLGSTLSPIHKLRELTQGIETS